MAQPTSNSSGPLSDMDMAAFGLPSSFSAMPKSSSSSSSKRHRGSDFNASGNSNGRVDSQAPFHSTASVSQGGRGYRGGHRGGMSRGGSAASHGHRGRGRGRGGGGGMHSGRGGHGHATNGSDRSAEVSQSHCERSNAPREMTAQSLTPLSPSEPNHQGYFRPSFLEDPWIRLS